MESGSGMEGDNPASAVMNTSWATESLHPSTSFGRHVIWWVIARPHSSQRPGRPVNDYEGNAINTPIQLQMVQDLHGKEKALLIHAVKEESRHVYRASGLCVTMMPIPDLMWSTLIRLGQTAEHCNGSRT